MKSGFSAMEIAGAVAHLVRENTASVAGELVLDAAWWTALRQCAAAAIQAEHHAHSERAGLGLAELRRAARSRGSRLLLGGAFAICAAPCIGPVLGSILVLASAQGTALEGAILLFAYSGALRSHS